MVKRVDYETQEDLLNFPTEKLWFEMNLAKISFYSGEIQAISNKRVLYAFCPKYWSLYQFLD